MISKQKIRGVILGEDISLISTVWTLAQQKRLSELLEIKPGIISRRDFAACVDWLSEVEVIFSSWTMPYLTDEELAMMPNLKAVFYAAGTVKPFADPLLERGITVVSAWAANAIPVAEFTFSQIIFGLKLGWQHLRQMQRDKGPSGWEQLPVPGVYNSTVGLISLGMVGRCVCEMIRPLNLQRLGYDPLLAEEEFHRLGVTSTDIETIFSNSEIVSLHAPWLPQTEGMITGELLARMKPNATFINTSRGALVNEPELIEVMRQRPDLTAILDVTWPEPPQRGAPIYELENIVITPHIAGSLGNELLRMSDLMIDEFLAWKDGRQMRYAITTELMATMA